MKKLLTAVLCLTLSLMLIPQVAHAEESAEEFIYDEFFQDKQIRRSNGSIYWNFTQENVYSDGTWEYIVSDPVVIRHQYYEMYFAGTYSTNWSTDPNPTTYSEYAISIDLVVMENDALTYQRNEALHVVNVSYDPIEEAYYVNRADVSAYAFKTARIYIKLNRLEDSYPLMQALFTHTDGISLMGNSISSRFEISYDPVPDTTGTIMDGLDQIGKVVPGSWSYIDNDFFAVIEYFGHYNLLVENVIFEDEDFLIGVTDIYYYTEDDEKYLVFYYSDDPSFLNQRSFAIWNISTSEIMYNHKLYIPTYIDKEDRKFYAYAHIPQEISDDLLGATVRYSYRYSSGIVLPFIGTIYQKHHEWETDVVVLEAGETTLADFPQWGYDYMTVSGVATGILGLVAMIPGTQAVSIPMLLLSANIFVWSGVAAETSRIVTGSLDDIVKLQYPNAELREKISYHFDTYLGIEYNPGIMPIYKLYLGDYTKANTNAVEIDPETYQYLEVTYVTNGTVYTITDENIEEDVVYDETDEAEFPEERTLTTGFNSLWAALFIPIFTIGYVIFAVKSGATKDLKMLIIHIIIWAVVVLAFGGLAL